MYGLNARGDIKGNIQLTFDNALGDLFRMRLAQGGVRTHEIVIAESKMGYAESQMECLHRIKYFIYGYRGPLGLSHRISATKCATGIASATGLDPDVPLPCLYFFQVIKRRET